VRSLAHLGLPANLRGTDKADLRLWPVAHSSPGDRFIPCEKSRIQSGSCFLTHRSKSNDQTRFQSSTAFFFNGMVGPLGVPPPKNRPGIGRLNLLRQKCQSAEKLPRPKYPTKRKGLARNMNFDDTARFFGPSDKLWPELFRPPVRQGTKLCLDCRKREVKPRQKYCRVCARNRKRESDRRHARGETAIRCRKSRKSRPVPAEY
jgi:hypothetical protein